MYFATIKDWLDRNKEVGILLLRLFIGIRLIYGVLDNVTSWDHMIAFRNFLAAHGFPFPLVSAVVSVFCQLFAGLFFIVGFKVRLAAAAMVFNFLVAVLTVHFEDNFESKTPALCMLFISLVLLFQGDDKNSIDRWIANKQL